jgi:uncharacterized protein (TIGR00255 family)
MIRSMTGFGEASGEESGAHFFIEARSINAKYFKSVLRLPDDLQGLEAELESELRRRLTRGTVTLTIKCSDISGDAAQTINHEALERYIEQAGRAPSVASGRVCFDLGSLLGLPGVLQPPSNDEQRLERARRAIGRLLERACAQLIDRRRREGELLLGELEALADGIAERLGRISERAPGVVEAYNERLRSRVESMLDDANLAVEPSDLVREVAVFAEKSDIAEELQRLSGHIAQFRELIGAPDEKPVGRTLDFLAQEMLREANTIGSKCNDAEISREIVEIKGAIDRIKEQVQNVE